MTNRRELAWAYLDGLDKPSFIYSEKTGKRFSSWQDLEDHWDSCAADDYAYVVVGTPEGPGVTVPTRMGHDGCEPSPVSLKINKEQT